MNHAFSRLSLLLLAAPVLANGAAAQTAAPRPDLPRLFASWQAEHGPNWRLFAAEEKGTLEMIAGGRMEPRFEPRDDADFGVLAREALAASAAMHGLDDATLVEESVLHLPLGMIGSTDKMTVRFRQVVRGVPVEGGFANVLLDMAGGVLSVQATGLPGVAAFPTAPALDANRAARRALTWFEAETGLVPTTVGAPELVIDQDVVDGQRRPRLAWKVDVQRLVADEEAEGARAFVDALDGGVYRSEENIHHFDVSGTVTSLATPGTLPDVASNPATAQPMRFLRVQSGATTTYTDDNGDFTLPGLTAPVSATFTYVGTYQNVQNAAGAAYSLTTTLGSATGNAVVMNSPAAATVTAQANCFRVAPLTRDFILGINPSDTHGNFVVVSNTAVSGACNAFYNGSSINFYNAGSGCVNSAYSTVISHELGHWMNDRYSTGNGSDGMGEGNADVWAMYQFDTAVVGASFSGSSAIRTGTNTRQFCGDSNPGCYGEVHDNGEVWMGAAWKVRNRLNNSLGNALGDLTANSLFLGWMNAYNQTQLRSIIETQWLTLDDTDGNINNGTPHYGDIDGGFRDQGFPGVPLLTLTISGVTSLADTLDEAGPYAVSATIVANQFPPVTAASVLVRVEGGAFTNVPMTNTSGDVWTALLPGVASPAHVEYYVQATDSSANTNRYPGTAPDLLFDFDVANVHVLRYHTFDVATDEGWTHGSVGDTSNSTDDWQRGTPNGKSGSSWVDPSSAFSPSQCWGTDLGAGNANGAYPSNVHTYLRTPVIDCTGATNVRLRFKRWLSVQGSNSDQARILVNGQQIFINPTTNTNDAAWKAFELPLGAIADDNPSVQVEWRLKSNGTSNYGGWNIDDVEILWLESVTPPCPAPQNYCSTAPNSVGPGAIMQWQGSTRIGRNDLELIATGCPPFSAGLFFYGQGATQAPFGNGFRCVGGTVYRLSVVPIDFLGDAHLGLDYNNLPQAIAAGEQWRFQFWYRNPAGGGAGFNLTDGLLVTFCP